MRNSKKLIAVIMTVALLASMMVPALAASYATEADALLKAGLMLGSDAGMDLDSALTREQGIILTVRAMGVEAAAAAMTEAEMTEALVNVQDAAMIHAWARPHAAYAVKMGITNGVGGAAAGKIMFAPAAPLSGQQFITMMLRVLGYTGDTLYANAINKAVEIGMLTASKAVALGMKGTILRDDAAMTIFAAVKTNTALAGGVTPSAIKLIDKLVLAGAVTTTAAVAFAYVAPTDAPAPALAVVSVTATNLKQLVVTFNQEIDGAGDADNYELDGTDAKIDDLLTVAAPDLDDMDGSDFALMADNKTVVITLDADAGQQESVDLTVSGITANDVEMAEQTIEGIVLLDSTLPVAQKAEVVGIDTIKVTFSEPIATFVEGDFTVADGGYSIKDVTIMNNGTEVNVELYSDLEAGNLLVEVGSGVKDYAGFGVLNTAFNVAVVEDTTAPMIVGFEEASETGVTLIFDGDIEISDGDVDLYYHTNTMNTVDAIVTADDVDGNKLTLKFTTYEMPTGLVYVYIGDDAVNDLWDNNNSLMSFKIEVTTDTVSPTLDDFEVNSELQVTLTFSEEMDSDTTEDAENYTLTKSGSTVDLIDGVTLNADGDIATMTFTEELDGDYVLTIRDVEDVSGNEIVVTTKAFTVDDMTDPAFIGFSAKIYDIGDDLVLIVKFGEEMIISGKYSILDLEKYALDGDAIADIEDVTIKAIDDNASVEITMPDMDLTNYDDASVLTVYRVADSAGNTTVALSGVVTLDPAGEIAIAADEVELTSNNTIVVTLTDDSLDVFEEDDFTLTEDTNNSGTVNGGDTELVYGKVRHTVVDGESVITFTLATDLETTDGLSDTHAIYVSVAATGGSENQYGEEINDGDYLVVDSAAPTVSSVLYVADDTIEITFSEDLESDTFGTATTSKNGFSVTGGTLTNALIAGGADSDTVILTSDDADFTVNTNVSYSGSAIEDLVENVLATFSHTDELAAGVGILTATTVQTAADITITLATAEDLTITLADSLNGAYGNAIDVVIDDNNGSNTANKVEADFAAGVLTIYVDELAGAGDLTLASVIAAVEAAGDFVVTSTDDASLIDEDDAAVAASFTGGQDVVTVNLTKDYTAADIANADANGDFNIATVTFTGATVETDTDTLTITVSLSDMQIVGANINIKAGTITDADGNNNITDAVTIVD